MLSIISIVLHEISIALSKFAFYVVKYTYHFKIEIKKIKLCFLYRLKL